MRRHIFCTLPHMSASLRPVKVTSTETRHRCLRLLPLIRASVCISSFELVFLIISLYNRSHDHRNHLRYLKLASSLLPSFVYTSDLVITMDVELYVYDLSRGLARTMSASLLGVQIDAVYHTSIVIEGVEYGEICVNIPRTRFN